MACAHSLDVHALAAGAYVVRVTGEATTLTTRLVKK